MKMRWQKKQQSDSSGGGGSSNSSSSVERAMKSFRELLEKKQWEQRW
jgi:hypothetical protein